MIAMREMTRDEAEDVYRNLDETKSMYLQDAAHRRAVDTFDDDKLSHLEAAAEDPDNAFEWDFEFYFSGYEDPYEPQSEYLDVYTPVEPEYDPETYKVAKEFGNEMLEHLILEIRATHIDEDDEDDSDDETPDDIIVHGRSREYTMSPYRVDGHRDPGCSETLEVEHGDEVEHVPLTDVRPAGYDLHGRAWGDDIPTATDMDRVYLFEGADIRAEAMLPNGHVVEVYRDGTDSAWVLAAEHGAADPATRQILWERPGVYRSDLKMLFDLGLSPALAVDYYDCHVRGLSHRDQRRRRSVTRQAIEQNVRKARETLKD
jgi:hypothetical protein